MIEYNVKVFENGTTDWFLNGRRHRENDLPAIEWANGTNQWWVDHKLHREDGFPAIEWADGSKEWWVNGVLEMTERKAKIDTSPAEELTVAEISKRLGYDVKIVK